MITEGRISDAASDVESKIGKLGHLTQEKLTDAAKYVRDRGVDGLRTDLTDAATRSPLRAIAMSLGIGYVIGRIMSRR